ncbi:MAG: light-harvesting protein [Pseudomonadota bacterium]
MNNAKMWLVVKPTIGVPVFLAGVAATSLTVHAYVLGSTSWMEDFLAGKEFGTSSKVASISPSNGSVEPATYTLAGSQEVLVKLKDGTVVKAVLQSPESVAMLE